MSYRPFEDYDNKPEEDLDISKESRLKVRHFLTLLLFFIVIGVLIFFYSPYSKIQEISITGTELIERELVLQATRVELGDSFLKVNPKTIESTIKKLKAVKDAQVLFHFPNYLEIVIEEKQVVAYIYNQADIIPLLEDGTTLVTIGNDFPYRARPMLSSSIQEAHKFKIATQLQRVPREVLITLSEIHIQEDGRTVHIYAKDGFELRMMLDEMDEKLSLYREIMDELAADHIEKGIVNMFEASWYISY